MDPRMTTVDRVPVPESVPLCDCLGSNVARTGDEHHLTPRTPQFDELDRRIIQLKIEATALKKENSETAKERLAKIESEKQGKPYVGNFKDLGIEFIGLEQGIKEIYNKLK